MEQLFKAMRETVPENSLFSGGTGEEMFTSMMDSHLAAQVPGAWANGLADALYRQLRGAMGNATSEGDADASSSSTAPSLSGEL